MMLCYLEKTIDKLNEKLFVLFIILFMAWLVKIEINLLDLDPSIKSQLFGITKKGLQKFENLD